MQLFLFFVNLFTIFNTINSYSVPNKLAYWRIKRSFILNNVLHKKTFPLIKYNNINNTKLYYLPYDNSFADFFEQHGEVSLLE